ncbi:hypothetical protein KY289_030522 [Solanum tuberosum]|nr:hypothetical protein KY289_030522 [Solanum tuberosum]
MDGIQSLTFLLLSLYAPLSANNRLRCSCSLLQQWTGENSQPPARNDGEKPAVAALVNTVAKLDASTPLFSDKNSQPAEEKPASLFFPGEDEQRTPIKILQISRQILTDPSR